MARLVVLSRDEGARIPFLRGILTRSLQKAGLEFSQAYEMSSAIRDLLSEREEISSRELRSMVADKLSAIGDDRLAENYRAKIKPPARVAIDDGDGHISPFSRGRLRQRLECSGLSVDDSIQVSRMIYDYLLREGISRIKRRHLSGLVYACLKREFGETEAHRYLVWCNFIHSGRPLILLIGGTAGSGKSTIATEVTGKLDIVRTQSTDMLREVMRMMLPERLMPVLHKSSFNACNAIEPDSNASQDEDALLKAGYSRQAELVEVACEAVIQRALREQVSLVLEGVHVRPALLDVIPKDSKAIVIPIMLGVLKKDLLKKRIQGRGTQVVHRRAGRYLENLDAIWRLQTMLLDDADRAGVSIIANKDKGQTIQEILSTINDKLSEEFSATPKQVFFDYERAIASKFKSSFRSPEYPDARHKL